MTDLTNYSDQELSLRVFNDQYLYVERGNIDYLVALCREEFTFTDEQLKVMLFDWLVDREENPEPVRSINNSWSIEDVQERDSDLTDDEAMEVLKIVEHNFDATIGINWDTIDIAIEQFKDAR